MNNVKIVVMAALAVLVAFGVAESQEMTGRDIALAVDNRPDGDDRKNQMTMTLINKRGRERVRKLISYSKEFGKDSKSVMVFKTPADVKGTGFLQFDYDDPAKDDDSWLYMPALRKTRRIAGSSKNDYFMGSDFTYDDMGDRNVDEDEHKLLKEEVRDGKTCWVVEAVAKDKGYMYSKRTSWIDKENYLPVYVEYYGRKGRLLKVLSIEKAEQINGIWTIMKMKMDNKMRHHQTVLEFENVQYDQGLKDSLFNIKTLERGRLK